MSPTRHQTTNALLFAAALAALATILFSAACLPGSTGETGALRFTDETQRADDGLAANRLNTPLAVGALMNVEVQEAAEAVAIEIQEASVADEGVAEIVAFDGGVLTLRGLAAGSTTLSVTSTSGLSDSIPVEVAAIAATEIHLLPWHPLFALPERLWQDGVVMLPDGVTDAVVMHRDAEGRMLTGYGAHEVVTTGDDVVTISAKSEENSDFFVIRAADGVGAVTIETDLGGSLSMDVAADQSVVAELALFRHETGEGPIEDGTSVELWRGKTTQLLHLAGYTADGAYVIGAGDPAFVAEVRSEQDPAPARVTISSAGIEDDEDGEDGIDPDDEADLRRAMSNARAFIIDASAATELGPSDVTLEATWAGQEGSWPLTFADDPAE